MDQSTQNWKSMIISFWWSYFSELVSINMHFIEQNSKYILSYLTLHSASQPLKELYFELSIKLKFAHKTVSIVAYVK